MGVAVGYLCRRNSDVWWSEWRWNGWFEGINQSSADITNSNNTRCSKNMFIRTYLCVWNYASVCEIIPLSLSFSLPLPLPLAIHSFFVTWLFFNTSMNISRRVWSSHPGNFFIRSRKCALICLMILWEIVTSVLKFYMSKSNIDIFVVTSFLCSLKFLSFHRIEYPTRCLWKKFYGSVFVIWLYLQKAINSQMPWPLTYEGLFLVNWVQPYKYHA